MDPGSRRTWFRPLSRMIFLIDRFARCRDAGPRLIGLEGQEIELSVRGSAKGEAGCMPGIVPRAGGGLFLDSLAGERATEFQHCECESQRHTEQLHHNYGGSG